MSKDKIISHITKVEKDGIYIFHDCEMNSTIKNKPSESNNSNGFEWRIQTNDEHCSGVAELASSFAAEFNMAAWGSMMGLLHDRGKESNGFQAYIKSNSGYDFESKSNLPKEHSYIGAILSHRLPFDKFYWLSNAIAGHHRGLYDIDELELVVKGEIPAEISQDIPDIKLNLPDLKLNLTDSSHIGRMLFSCLVDADWLNTETFMNPDRISIRGDFLSLEELNTRLQSYCETLKNLPSAPINKLRNKIQQRCEEAAALDPGFFDLMVPTGGGKTIASIIWAIRHAILHKKRRIIIAIPFTSIIVQTAAKLREIFGDENVVEHHSALNDSEADDRSLLACENWDAPIIVTTNVQLFESMYSNRRSDCRKLHSIVNSVVILDEIQTLPLTLLQPIVNVMQTYTKLFGASFLFCTASLPILDSERKGCNGAIFKGIDRKLIRSIISNDMKLHDKFRRVRVSIDNRQHTYETLASNLKCHQKVLCVVSSRRHALELYKELSKDSDIPTFHLSRSMCSAHILNQIEKIKEILKSSDKGIRVVSTQLIEAGVDIDFPVVYRQLSGLDSILQAAGRCNREGNEKEGVTNVFTFKEDQQSSYLRFATDTMKDIISMNPDSDWLSTDTMRLYYEKLYSRTPSFDKDGIVEMLKNPMNCQYEEASMRFHLINDNGINIIINFRESQALIQQLIQYGPSRKLSRQLGRFSVNVQKNIFKELKSEGLIEEPYPGFYYIPFEDQYDSSVGLKTNNEMIEQTFII